MAIEFSREARNYFAENGDFTGNLLGEIFRLTDDQVWSELNPLEFEPGMYKVEILSHLVYLWRLQTAILVVAVQPIEDSA